MIYDEGGEPYTVRYHLLAPLLVNELQRERHNAVARDEGLQREIAALRERLRRLEGGS